MRILIFKQQSEEAAMSKKEMTLVYYYVPEDKDDPDCPNVFGVPYSKTSLRLQHIYQSFPLKGSYLFRFKYSCEGQVVWLDLPDLDAKLPTFKDKVYVKATRVSWTDSKLHSHYKDKPANIQLPDTSSTQRQVDFFENSSQPPKKEEARNTTNTRIDFLKQKPQPAQSNQSNLLEQMHIPKNGNYLQGSPNANSIGMDFLGGMSSPSIPAAQKKTEINLMHGFEKQDHGDLI